MISTSDVIYSLRNNKDSDHLRASRLSTFRSKLATRDEPSASAANFAKLSRGCFAGSMDPGAPT